jgi:hypothetical protein
MTKKTKIAVVVGILVIGIIPIAILGVHALIKGWDNSILKKIIDSLKK